MRLKRRALFLSSAQLFNLQTGVAYGPPLRAMEGKTGPLYAFPGLPRSTHLARGFRAGSRRSAPKRGHPGSPGRGAPIAPSRTTTWGSPTGSPAPHRNLKQVTAEISNDSFSNQKARLRASLKAERSEAQDKPAVAEHATFRSRESDLTLVPLREL